MQSLCHLDHVQCLHMLPLGQLLVLPMLLCSLSTAWQPANLPILMQCVSLPHYVNIRRNISHNDFHGTIPSGYTSIHVM